MKEKLIALILAGTLTLSLAACVKKPDNTNTDPNESTLASSTDVSPVEVIPESLDLLLSHLKEGGFAFEYEVNKSGLVNNSFLYPQLNYSFTVNVGNGEVLRVYGYNDLEKTQAHIACYSKSGSEYTVNNSDGTSTEISIDYVAPIHLWSYGGSVIEYCSETGELLSVLDNAFGTQFAGYGEEAYESYVPSYAIQLVNLLQESGHSVTAPKVTDSKNSGNNTALFSLIDGMGSLYVYRYENVEELLEHSSSPIEAPVLETITHWTDTENLIAIEYLGDDENIIALLDNTYMSGVKQLAANTIQYVRTDYTGLENSEPTVKVYISYDELTDGVQLDLLEGHPYTPYTREWFEGNALMVVTVVEGSGSNRHELKAVAKSGNKIAVNINRIMPEVGTCDMATWNIYIGISKSELDENTEYSVNINSPEQEKAYTDIYYFDENVIRTNAFSYGREDSLVVIRTRTELENYYNDNKDKFYLESADTVYADTSIGFADTFDTYTREWFQENILLMGIVEEGSGSIRHRVDGVIMEADDKLSLRYTPLVPEVCTEDMAAWHIMVGIKEADYENASEAYLHCNDALYVTKTLFPAEYITAERISDVKKIMIGNYNQQDIRNFWGEPDASLSGMWGEIYNLGDDSTVCIYYDSSATVEEVLLSLSGKHVYTLNDITEDSFESIKNIIINHKWTLEELEKIWGEPSHKEQSDKSYTWELSSGVSLVVTEFEYVDMIIPYVKNPLDSIPWLSVVSKSNLKAVSEHLVGNYTIVDIWDAWGEPKGVLYGEVAYGYEMSDGGIIWVYYKGTEGYIDKLIITDSIVFVEDFALENVTVDNIIQFEAFFMGSTYKEVVDFWGKPYDETTGVGSALYDIGDNMFVQISFDSDGVVESVEMLSRTPLAQNAEAIDKLSSPLYCLTDIEWLNEQLVGKVGYEWLWEKWGTPELAATGEDVFGDGWIIMDSIDLMVYYDTDDAESTVKKIVIERDPSEWECPGIIGSQLIGKYTYQEVIDMWGMPNQKTKVRWGMVYEIGDEYFLTLYFGEDDVITEAVFSPRTSLE